MNRKSATVWTALVASLSLLSGCGGSVPETQFFLLTAEMDALPSENQNIDIRYVRIPAYLQRKGIALAVGDHQIRHADYYQWAEPMHEGVERVLRAELETLAVGDQQLVEAVGINVQLMHGDVRGTVILDADYSVEVANCATPYSGRFRQETEQQQDGYEDLVRSHVKLIGQLARTIQQTATENRDCSS